MSVSGISKPLGLRLFLEGQEVPVISANVNIGMNAPAVASIQVIPLDAAMDLKPRTMVHLFFLDQVPTETEIAEAKSKGTSEEDVRRLYYKLLFTGEVVGFAFAQTPMTRNIVLQCVDFTSYWDACHATAIEYGTGGNAFFNQSALYGSNTSNFDDIVNHQSEQLVSWVRQNPLTPGLQNVSGLAGGIIRVLEAMSGVNGYHRGVNDFFTVAELRCRILAQITAEENDNTAASLLRVKVFDEWLRNGLQNIGQQVTFRDIVKLLCQYIYYDFVPNPVAKYDADYAKSGQEKTAIVTELKSSPLIANVVATLRKINESLAKARNYDNRKAIINMATWSRDELDKQDGPLSKVKETQDIRAHIQFASIILTERVINLNNSPYSDKGYFEKTAEGFAAAIVENLKAIEATGTLPKVNVVVGVKSAATTARLRTTIFRPDCFFAAAPRCNVIFPEHFSQVSYDRSYLSEVTRSLVLVYNSLVGRDGLLAQKILAPNNGFDMKKLEQQVGVSGYRILLPHELHTGIIPRSEWLPTTASFGKQANEGADKQQGARLKWADRAALFHFFKYRFGPRRASVAGRFNPYLVCGFPSVVLLKPFIVDPTNLEEVIKSENATLAAQQAAKTRSSSVSATPTSTLTTIEYVQKYPVKLGAPYHLVGMIGGISHTVDQSGGVTNASLHHVRKHQGVDDEFIGVFSKSKKKAKYRIRVPLRAQDVFDLKATKETTRLVKVLVGITPAVAQKKPKAQAVTELQKDSTETTFYVKTVDPVTKESKLEFKSANLDRFIEKYRDRIPQYAKVGRIDGVDRDVQVPSPPGSLTTGGKGVHGKIIGVEVVDPLTVQIPSGTYAGKWVYRSVVLHEEVETASTQDVPIEEIIRPGWFSEKYMSNNIGSKIYMPFFGTTSIVDGLEFTGLRAGTRTFNVPDPEGTTYTPTARTEQIIKELSDNASVKNALSIERAVNVLAYLYGLAKTDNKDIDAFIRQYTHRPVATMIDMLGTSNFEAQYSSNGKITSIQGSPGFHGIAVDRKSILQGRLAGLLDDPDKKLPRILKSGANETIPAAYDVRKDKLLYVDRYILELKKGPGLRG